MVKIPTERCKYSCVSTSVAEELNYGHLQMTGHF